MKSEELRIKREELRVKSEEMESLKSSEFSENADIQKDHINPDEKQGAATGDITLREAQRLVDQWIKQYGVRYFSELTNMACLTEEVGELARVMARKYGDQSFKNGEPTDPAEEMADVLWVLICLANQTGTDLTEALKKSFEKKTARDKNRHINNEKLTG